MTAGSAATAAAAGGREELDTLFAAGDRGHQLGDGYHAGPRIERDIEEAFDEVYECTWTRAAVSSCAKGCEARYAALPPVASYAMRAVVVVMCYATLGACMYTSGYLFMTYSIHGRHMRPPAPPCTYGPGCVEDFVVASARAWSPPPVWSVADYRGMFEKDEAYFANLTMNDIGYIIVVDSYNDDAIQVARDTWASTPGVSGVTFMARGIGGVEFVRTSGTDTIISLGMTRESPTPRGMPDEELKSLIRGVFQVFDPTRPWHFLGARTAMPFPEALTAYAAGFDSNTPLIVGRVLSTAPRTTLEGTISVALHGTQAPDGVVRATWVDLESGILVSRFAMEMLLGMASMQDRHGVQSLDMTISDFAWSRGIFMADEPAFRGAPPPDANADSKDPRNPPKLELCTHTLGLKADPKSYKDDVWMACRLVKQAMDAVGGP